MYERLKRIIAARRLRDDALESGVKQHLVQAYRLRLDALQAGQAELACLTRCYMFDLLDWARRKKHFAEDTALLAAGARQEPAAHPATVHELELLLEDEAPTADMPLFQGAANSRSLEY